MVKIHIIDASHSLKSADSVCEKRTTFVYNTSSLAIKRKTSRDAAGNYNGIASDTLSDTLLEILNNKKITLVAAVTGKVLTGEFAALLPSGVFHNLLNAGPLAVREMVFEVPRSCLHENEGINRKTAMYIAHNAIALCNATAGLALVMQPQAPQAYVALSAAGQVACLEIDMPTGLNEHEAIGLVRKHILRFCKVSLQAYPDDIPNSISVSEFLAESEEIPAVLKLLRPKRQHAIT